ncbi:MAG: hypothetical protein COA43_12960 [Robiginitomaculum sp.]|nr:MAG: hypothetical protein COA43_12960 [Robiginitomaculum sp.]
MFKNINRRALLKGETSSSSDKFVFSFGVTVFACFVMGAWLENLFLLFYYLIIVFSYVQYSQYAYDFRVSFIQDTGIFMEKNEPLEKTFLYPYFSRGWRGEKHLETHGEKLKLFGLIFSVLFVFMIVGWSGFGVITLMKHVISM